MANEFEKLENALFRAGREMEYPATPAIAARVRVELTRGVSPPAVVPTRNWTRVLVPFAAALVLAIALLFAVPNARDAVAQFLGLNNVRIFYATPTPTALPTFTPRPTFAGVPTTLVVPVTATPRTTEKPNVKPLTLCCEMTLAEAQRRAQFKLLLPSNQVPTQVYYQNVYDNGEQVVMVFGDPLNPRFTLYQAQRWIYGKMFDGGTQAVIQETHVNGTRALWFSGGSHLLMRVDNTGAPRYDTERVVDANTLVWETGNDFDGIIYRIETKLSMLEAIRFAETLKEYKP